MTTIEIQKDTREKIKEYSLKGETVDETLNRLISESTLPTEKKEKPKPPRTNIHLTNKTLVSLKKFAITPTDSYNDIITRLILESEEKH